MQKIVINICYGGFGLSKKALTRYKELKGLTESQEISYYEIPRNDPDLIKVVEELGDEANGGFAELHITEIPDGVKWVVEEYDGNEHVAEAHRTWR